jgi:hypothetical protein
LSVNSHLHPQLDAFAALDKPGFAILVDAPWGAGKTHAITGWLRGKPHLYVSLYGVDSREAVERAVMAARLNAQDNAAARAVGTLIAGRA